MRNHSCVKNRNICDERRKQFRALYPKIFVTDRTIEIWFDAAGGENETVFYVRYRCYDFSRNYDSAFYFPSCSQLVCHNFNGCGKVRIAS